MDAKGMTRRGLLIGGAAATITPVVDAWGAVVDLRLFAKRRLTVFRNYADRAFPGNTRASKDRLDAPDYLAGVLWVSDLAPSSFVQHKNVVLLRPVALATAPMDRLAEWIRSAGPMVVAAPSSGSAREPSYLWRRLAELLARPGTPDETYLDLGGAGSDDDAVLEGIDRFRRTYAELTGDRVALRCPQGPILPIG